MRSRNLILTTLGLGALLGVVGGVAVNPSMKPVPEPTWRHAAQPTAPMTQDEQLVDSGPQDLSPTWYLDRMPTWKRRAVTQSTSYALADSEYPPERSVEEAVGQVSIEAGAEETSPAEAADGDAAPDSDVTRAAMTPPSMQSVGEQWGPSGDAASPEAHDIQLQDVGR